MRKSLFFAAALLALAACTREVAVEVPEGDITLVARTEAPAGSRTIVEGETHVWWEPGDEIKVFVGTESGKFTTDITESAATATFNGSLDVSAGADIWAVYPFQEAAAFADGTVTTVLPAAQVARAGSFEKDLNPAIAHSTTAELQFRNVAGGVKFCVSKTGITKVTFKGNNAEPLAGTVKVGLDGNGVPVVSEIVEAATEITLTAPAGGTFEPGQWYFIVALPATLPDGYTMTFTYADTHGEFTKSDKAVEIKRSRFGKLTNPDANAQFAVPTYRITNMWVVGGTGPDYGGVGVIDILTKPDYFNNEDGRGITALVDNYYQLRPDGTFVNYAGADARNWWFVYSGSVNPVDGKDIDLRKFYDVLPLKDGHYAVDGAQVTFTKADASTTTATFVGPGTYEVPSTGKSVTIQRQALMFTLTGGKDDWTNIYKDYDKIAGRPRALFIEMEQLPADFVVPEASRTTDADFQYIPPQDPGPGGDFDWTTIPGNWNVYGGNSSPFGIWVLGGSGDDPAFVSPIDKGWCWNYDVKKETDNVLTIAVTSISATQATGTTTWSAGADGQFWNYTWNYTGSSEALARFNGQDLSQFYDKIPKGQVAFTLDFNALTVTWENGTTARILLPGNHTFVYNKTLKNPIPDNCFALWFHLMDPIAPTSDRWNDADRFILAPLEYVIIFEKM